MNIVICSLAPMENNDGTFTPLKNSFAYRSSCPYNIYLLASIMEKGGYEINIKDWYGNKNSIEEMFKELLDFDIIMISANSWNWHPSRWVIEKLRLARENQIIIIGGLQATLFGKKIIEEFPVDYVIRGEGEKSVIPLLRFIEKKEEVKNIPGLIYRKKGDICINPVSPLLTSEEMVDLPTPLYERLPEDAYYWLSIESSRGCINHCIYCSIPYQRSWRPLAPEKFVERIESYIPFLEKVITKKFLFIDDSFIIDINRAREIAGLLKKRKLKIKAIWNSLVQELFEKELIKEMAPYTDTVLVGAESFNEENLKKIGKKFSPEDIIKGTESALETGLSQKLLFSFIIGFPWQNKKDIIEEINKIYDLVYQKGVCATINWLILNPGSQIWRNFYGKKDFSLNDFKKIYEHWKKEIFPLTPQEVDEVNLYISYLQNTIPGGTYRFQQHSSIYNDMV